MCGGRFNAMSDPSDLKMDAVKSSETLVHVVTSAITSNMFSKPP
jgi:hypothetical protein